MTGWAETPILSERILDAPPLPADRRVEIGRSREGRPLHAARLGSGPERVSLIAGCHADEPVGPRLLLHLAGYLAGLPDKAPLLRRWEWWIVPHVNPDGAARNRSWQRPVAERYSLADFLAGVVRESPPEDVEFGFPRDTSDGEARPENRALVRWWEGAGGPFRLHASLHGMAFGAGPWFLVDAAWSDRLGELRERCEERTRSLGYRLHDVDRRGEKGFHRLGPGFSTRPNSEAMRAYFLRRDRPETAAAFRRSSMETVRGLGGDPLTLVTEMPLFLVPWEADRGEVLLVEWRARFEDWARRIRSDEEERGAVRREALEEGVRPMPVADQMRLCWTLVASGLRAVSHP